MKFKLLTTSCDYYISADFRKKGKYAVENKDMNNDQNRFGEYLNKLYGKNYKVERFKLSTEAENHYNILIDIETAQDLLDIATLLDEEIIVIPDDKNYHSDEVNGIKYPILEIYDNYRE